VVALPQKLTLAPGINRDASQLAMKGGWWDANLVRWRDGQPEKWKGWTRFGTQEAIGVPRSLLAWNFLTGDAALAVGTSARLMISKGGTLYDVTPVDREIAIVDGISTVSGSPTVTVDFPSSHNALAGDYIFLSAVTVGGLALGAGADGFGCYLITAVPTATRLEFQAQANASSTVVSGGGAVDVSFLYPTGGATGVAGLGWGAGGWGESGWGLPAAVPTGTLPARTWSLDKWGQDLVAVPAQGPLFAFSPDGNGNVASRAERVVNALDGTVLRVDVTNGGSGYSSAPTVTIAAPPSGTTATATAVVVLGAVVEVQITNAGSGYISAPAVSFSGGGGSAAAATAVLQPIRSPPLRNAFMLVGSTERNVILLGSSDLGDDTNFDPMLIRWSRREDRSDFLPSSTSSAGFRRAQVGSRLVAGCNLTLVSLVWSDTAAHQMRYVGAPFWYSVEVVGRNCGLIGPGAFAEAGGAVYWQSQDGFWMWRGGAPQRLNCTLDEDVFGNINRDQLALVACGTNSGETEVTWFYPSAGSNEVDRYITLNIGEACWYGGALARSAWADRGAFGVPIAAAPDGRLYQHEVGVDADGQPMGEFLESGYIDIADGSPFTAVEQIIPDWQRLVGAVEIEVRFREYQAQAPRVRGPYTVTPSTRWFNPRGRGREVAVRIAGVGTGNDWRLGAMRLVGQGVGGR
jgi:hypothetical protein